MFYHKDFDRCCPSGCIAEDTDRPPKRVIDDDDDFEEELMDEQEN